MIESMRNWGTAKKITLSFMFVILVGSLLLSLPMSQSPTSEASYFDNLFNATSMVCVTGLFIVAVQDTYTIFGQVVALLLMQIGGLGLMSIVASVITGIGGSLSLRDRLAVQESINQSDSYNLRNYLSVIIRYTFLLECIGGILLSFRFVPLFGWKKGLFTSLFLSVSAFNNAGYDNLGNNSLITYVHDPLINLILAFLIIMGGIGFAVWYDVTHKTKKLIHKKGKKTLRVWFDSLSLHTKLTLFVTFFLILIGTITFVFGEYTNTETIAPFSLSEKILTGFFQTTTLRTAGFSTIDYSLLRPFTLFWFILTMFIGGSPGGTAGGLKTTTFAMVTLLIYNGFTGQRNVNVGWHTIPAHLIRQAVIIFFSFITIFIIGTALLLAFNPHINPVYLIFETVSALATVGLSVNLTPTLGTESHVVIIILMFMGRIGPITLVESLRLQNEKAKDITYVEENILIG